MSGCRTCRIAALLGVFAGGGSPADAASARIERDGVRLDLDLTSQAGEQVPLRENEAARLTVQAQDAAGSQPLRYRQPGAWLDFADSVTGRGEDCAARIAGYRRGGVGAGALLDLNGYYVLFLNRDDSIAVVDPQTRFDGKTNVLGLISLQGRGVDWIKTRDERRLFVSLEPSEHSREQGSRTAWPPVRLPGRVAVIDGASLRVQTHVTLPAQPGRMALPPDQRLLWVGHDGRRDGRSGASVVDAATLKPLDFVPLPDGHHEFAFNEDSGKVLITSRGGRAVTLLDARRRRVLRRIGGFGMPIAAGYSRSAAAFFVADARHGTLTTLNENGVRRGSRTRLKPGLGPMRITPDGRWVLLLNTAEATLDVVDTADQKLRHRLPVPARPYQLELSQRYGYVRSLGSERLILVQLASLITAQPIVQQVTVGLLAPELAPELPLAAGMAPAGADQAMIFASPADNTAYFYMEGMNAASSSLRAHGHDIRAVMTMDRGLRESGPGIYTAYVRLPAAGLLQVAVAFDNPFVAHCLAFSVEPAAAAEGSAPSFAVDWLEPGPGGESRSIGVRLAEGPAGKTVAGLTDLHIVLIEVGGARRVDLPAAEPSPGRYRADLPAELTGTYYAHVAIPSRRIRPGDLPYRSVTVLPRTSAADGRVAP